MASEQMKQVAAMLRPPAKKEQSNTVNVEAGRMRLEKFAEMICLPEEAKIERIELANRECEILTAPNCNKERAVLYLHGGSYLFGSLNTHREIAYNIAQASGSKVYNLDYRLAPENEFPAPLVDAMRAYRDLLERGYKPENIVIAGDSAGGGLALATLMQLSDEGTALPTAAVCLSPWVDLSPTYEELKSRMLTDGTESARGLHLESQIYLGGRDPKDPRFSPLFGDALGLPPILIQAGSNEMLLEDSIRFAEKAKKAGVDVTLEIEEGAFHVYQAFASMVPEGMEAIKRIGKFIKNKAGG